MMTITRTLLTALLTGIFVNAYSQKQVLRFDHLETSQGLSQSNVICILQDSKGFMWFGTRDGLNKYDGYGFTIYRNDPQNKNSVSHNTIQALVEDSQGNIWIGTSGGGLNKFDPSKEKFTRYTHDDKDPNSISSDMIRGNALMIDSDKNLWIGTSIGLNKLAPNSGKFIHYIHSNDNPQSISSNDIRAINEDKRHNIWVGTQNGGVNLLNKKDQTFMAFLHDQNDTTTLSSNMVRSIFVDSRNQVWVGTQGSGLDLFDPERKKFRHFKNDIHNPASLSHNAVITIAEGAEGHIWIGTENGGLNILDPVTGYFARYLHDDIDRTSLNHNSIYCIYPDKHEGMWIGTFGGGANIVSRDANKFVTYQHTTSLTSLNHNNILNIFEDSKNNLWIGTDGGGLNLFDRKAGTFTHFLHNDTNKNSICGNYVLEVFEDPKQNLWIGTWGDGLTVFNREKNTYKHYRNNPSDPTTVSSNNCWMVFRDSQGNTWIGTKGGGLNLYDPVNDNFIHYRHDINDPASISSDFLTEVFEDSKGNLWIGTDGEGLELFDRKTKQFTHFTHDEIKNSLSSNIITCIFEDSHNNLWLGTDGGLNKFDRTTNHFSHYLTTDGLPNNFVHGILEDGSGNLWISTNKGLSRFNLSGNRFENFSVADGLQADEFKQSRCKSRSGMMYFGGVNGFNEFDPAKIRNISFDPSLVITGFKLFNKDVAISDNPSVSPLQKSITDTKTITLSYSNSEIISIEFASLNYTIPEKKKYQYMLEGSDSKWNDVGTNRVATYTNLSPGKYTFKVRGLNNDGSWSHMVTSFDLTVTPPFWQTWWFRLLVVLLVVGSAIGFHRVRMRVVNKQKKKLEEQVAELLDKAVAQGKYEIASDVMHDIGNAMVGFGSYLTRIRRILEQTDQEKMQKLVEFFTTNKPAMVNAVGEAKADAIIKLLCGIALAQRSNQEEMSKSVTEQFNIIGHVQEILNIQRQYIKGHETGERQPVNLKTVINDSMTMVFASLDKNAIDVSLDIPADLPIIKGDRTKLMQVMLNILKNSIEAIDKNSKEKIISLSAYKQSNTLIVQLKDNGTGFDKPTGEKLFDRGFTTKASGTGLGLYNCRTIVESHDGTIDIASEGPGKGTVTTIGFKLSA